MPKSFNGIDVETTPDVRIPLAKPYEKFEYSLAARLRPGVSLERARAETESIVNVVTDIQERTAVRDEHLEIEPAAKGVSLIRPKFATGLILLMCGVALLLLMSCANAGGLLLARASARQAVTAVRVANGPTTGPWVREGLSERFALDVVG